MRPIVLANLIPDTTLPCKAARKPGRPREKRFRTDNVNTRIRKDSRRKGETATARSTREAKKAKQKELDNEAKRAKRLEKRKDDSARKDAMDSSSKDKEYAAAKKAYNARKSTLKSTSSLSKTSKSSSAKAAERRRQKSVTISDNQASDSSDYLSDSDEPTTARSSTEKATEKASSTTITFESRKEAEAAVMSTNEAIVEAAERYLDPDADEDEDEDGNAVSQPAASGESLGLTLQLKRSLEAADSTTLESTASKRQRGPCRHCGAPDHAFLTCLTRP